MQREAGAAQGRVRIWLYGPDGGLKDYAEGPNLLTNAGLTWQAGRWAADASIPDPISHIAVGDDDDPAPAVGQAALNNELNRQALDAAPTVKTTNVANDTWTYKATFGPGEGTGAIVEYGLFTAAVGGVMVARTIKPVKNKDASDTLVVEWDLIQTRAA